jgi:hypothetical protein
MYFFDSSYEKKNEKAPGKEDRRAGTNPLK